MGNNTIAVFHCGNAAKASPLFQWDYGQILQVEGIELPEVWTAHFANDARGGTAYQAIGGADGVVIPDELLTTGKAVYCWIYLHTGEDDGETEYQITIPVIPRPEPTEEQPTPEQQGVIDQAIAALGVAVQEAQEAAAAAEAASARAPYIGETGNWMEWDSVTGDFVDTGVPAAVKLVDLTEVT